MCYFNYMSVFKPDVTKATRYPKILMVLVVVIVAFCLLYWFPQWEVARYGITNPKDLSDAENGHRATLAQILGGIAVGFSLYYTWRRVTIAEKDLKVSQEGQITERFTRAIDQLGAIDKLGKPAIEIRLGGIYGLERIANESEKDYWPIMEILTAYVRKNSRILEERYENENEAEAVDEYIDEKTIEIFYFDIQAIIAVIRRSAIIRRSRSSFNTEESNYLDLNKTDLRRSNFQEADLRRANLEEANLKGSNLKGANLVKAKLVKAKLQTANLEQAKLKEANLKDTNFYHANLQGADLQGAELKGADLRRANLEEADLNGSKNLTISQLSRVKTLYNAKLDDELRISLEKEHPELLKVPTELLKVPKTILKLNPE